MVVLHMLFIDMQDIPEKYMYRVFVAVFFLTTFIAIGHAAPLFFLIVSLLFHVGIVRIYTCVRKNHRIYRRVSPWRMIT